MPTNTIRVYAAGGTAANIANIILKHSVPSTEGLADLDFVFVDTSRSNLRPEHEDRFYHIHDPSVIADGRSETDGSGKDRKFIYELAAKHTPTIIHRHPPTDFNIVIHSGYGGSGSVAGQLIVKELLEAGKEVITILIGGEADEAGIVNTLRVIQGYQNMAETISRSVVVNYLHTDQMNPPSIVRAKAVRNLGFLSALLSGENHGLDKQDIRNFLNPEVKTRCQPGLVGLLLGDSGSEKVDLQDGEFCSNILSLATDDDQASPPFLVPYYAYGIPKDEVFSKIAAQAPVHAMAIQNHFPALEMILRSRQHDHKEAFKSVRVDRIRTDEDADVVSGGIVL